MAPKINPTDLLLILILIFLLHHSLALPLFPITPANQTLIYIVHVWHPHGPAELLAAGERERWYHSFLPNATLDSGEPRMVHTYSAAMSGFAARLTAEELRLIEAMPGFLFAHADRPFHLRTTYTPTLLGLNEYDSLWQHSEKGQGVIIGVFDGGITPDHPSFAEPSANALPSPPLKWRGTCQPPVACSNKLIGAQSFNHEGNKTPVDDSGHGTHVAAIAAGTPVPAASVKNQAPGTASGIAPRAHLAVYKVKSVGSASNADIIKGFDKAILDGVDLIQISIGAENYDYSCNGITIGSYAALKRGILTVNSAGNSGPHKSILDNDVPWILHVGAANIDRRVTATLTLGNGMEFVGMSANPASSAPDLPLVYPGVKNTGSTLLCLKNKSMAGVDVVGKMVLCYNGHIENTKKAEIVKAAGGAAIVIMNQISHANTLSADAHGIPAVHVSSKDAVKILNYFSTDKNNPTGTITFKGTEYGIRPSPTVASFSSRGPSLLNGGILKPDVIAPGVNILSAWPFEVGAINAANKNFVMKSGTSMAAPHVSGVAALLKKLHPEWSPAEIKSAIMTTAYTEDRDGVPFVDDASDDGGRADVFAVGAGHINPSAAKDPGLVYDFPNADDYIPYLCNLKGYTSEMVTRIVNQFVTCDAVKKMEAEEVNYASIQVSMGAAGAQKKSVRRTVKNVGEAISKYKASVVKPKGVDVVVRPETLEFGMVGEEKNFTVELSLVGKTKLLKDDVLEGRLKWVSVSAKGVVVSSPIVVTA